MAVSPRSIGLERIRDNAVSLRESSQLKAPTNWVLYSGVVAVGSSPASYSMLALKI